MKWIELVRYWYPKHDASLRPSRPLRLIAENHHGTIDFDSVEDEGTTFMIMLPVINQG